MVKEIEVASQIQKTLLPSRLPEIPGLEIDTYYQAAEVVGGDLYDIFEIEPGCYCLVVADVSGKGVPASLVMSMLRTVIQIQSGRSRSARETLIHVYDYLKENIPPGMFITVMLTVYEVERRRLSFVSAGHNPMLYYDAATGEIKPLNPTGMPMGVPTAIETTFEERLQEYNLDLQDGDLFFMFTDGITEASNRDGQYFGMDRLIRFLKSRLAGSEAGELSAISAGLVAELEDFSGLSGPADDITFVIARAVGGSERNVSGTHPEEKEHSGSTPTGEHG
jgi:sigma-B regulation protein RsbU (phosphoserine phosphatase)